MRTGKRTTSGKQDQLWLEFDRAAAKAESAVQEMNQAAKEILKGETTAHTKNDKDRDEEEKALRKRVVRIANSIAFTQEAKHQSVFVRAYEVVKARTGIDLIAEGHRRRTKAHLDVAAEKGLLAVVLDVLCEMKHNAAPVLH